MADENGFDEVNGKAEVEEHTLENGETDEDEKGILQSSRITNAELFHL